LCKWLAPQTMPVKRELKFQAPVLTPAPQPWLEPTVFENE